MDTAPQNLIDALGITSLPPEEQEALLLDLNALIVRGSMLRLMERMDEQTRADFHALMEGNPDEAAMGEFLRTRVPDADTAVTETVQQLTDDILAGTDTNQK